MTFTLLTFIAKLIKKFTALTLFLLLNAIIETKALVTTTSLTWGLSWPPYMKSKYSPQPRSPSPLMHLFFFIVLIICYMTYFFFLFCHSSLNTGSVSIRIFVCLLVCSFASLTPKQHLVYSSNSINICGTKRSFYIIENQNLIQRVCHY